MSDSESGSTPVVGQSGDMDVVRQTTAEDLLALYDKEEKDAKVEVDKEVDKQIKVSEELPKKIIANKVIKDLESKEREGVSETQTPPQDLEESKEDSKEESSEESSEEDSEEEDSEKELPLKTYKARLGDQELDIPEEALIPVKVNDKNVNLKVKDAVDAYVKQDEFNRNMHRRISIIDNREKKLEAEYKGVEHKARQVLDMVQNGDFFGSIKSLAKVAGIDSELDQVALEKAFFNQLGELNKVWGEMTPQQREVYFANRKAEMLQSKLETTRQETERVQLERELAREIDELCEQNKMSMEDFNGSYQVLAKELVGEGKPWATASEIQPADVVRYHQQVGTMKTIQEALAEEKSSGMFDTHSDAIDTIATMSLEQGLDKQQVKELTKDIVKAIKSRQPNRAAENLNRKVAKAGQTAQLNPANSANKKNEKIEGYEDPSDLDWMYRKAPRSSTRAF